MAVFTVAPILAVLAVRGNPEIEDVPPTEEPKVAVLMAKQKMAWATRISEPEKVFTQVWFRKGEVPPGAVTSLEQVRGTYLKENLKANELVLESWLWELPAGVPVPEGRKVIGYRFQWQTAMGGWLGTPFYADILLSYRGTDRDEVTTIYWVRNILFLQMHEEKFLIAVTDEEERKLSQGSEKGSLTIVPLAPKHYAPATESDLEKSARKISVDDPFKGAPSGGR